MGNAAFFSLKERNLARLGRNYRKTSEKNPNLNIFAESRDEFKRTLSPVTTHHKGSCRRSRELRSRNCGKSRIDRSSATSYHLITEGSKRFVVRGLPTERDRGTHGCQHARFKGLPRPGGWHQVPRHVGEPEQRRLIASPVMQPPPSPHHTRCTPWPRHALRRIPLHTSPAAVHLYPATEPSPSNLADRMGPQDLVQGTPRPEIRSCPRASPWGGRTKAPSRR